MRSSAALPPQPSKRSTSFDPDVAAAVGKVIRNTREEQGHSQDGFALLAGVDRSYYGKLERGERQPTVGLLLRVARALGVSGADLLAQAEALLSAPPKRRRASSR
ncbi:MAG: transcriptional regulator [Methylibium sp.]|nr:transcriptional regulator [Methylibium sp.]